MFSKRYSFRYCDLDESKNIKISTVMELLEDISISHSGNAGFPIKKLYAHSRAFLLQGWRIRFKEPLISEADAEVKTGILKIRRVEAVRKYEIWQENRLKTEATAVWFMVDTDEMKIVDIPEKLKSAYESVNEPDNSLPFIKIRNIKNLKLLGETKVARRDIDTNGHMNNVKSAEAALEFLPPDMSICELQVTYRKELFRGSPVSIYAYVGRDEYGAELKNDSGESCVLVKALGTRTV